MLLTGYGLKPAPRHAAGWDALANNATPQASWAAARRALGLSRRQAVAFATTRLLLWHWSQPLAYLFIFRVCFCVLQPEQVLGPAWHAVLLTL
jgi:hypothetical protein